MNRKQIEDNLILLAITGSHAYGTNLPDSDIDLKGITIPPIEYYLTTKKFEQKDSWDINDKGNIEYLDKHKDKVIYSITKFMDLVEKQNPNVLDLLWLPQDCILIQNSVHKELIVYREYLLSQKVYPAFSGYANTQIGKMEKHRKWLLAEAEGKVMQIPNPADYLPTDVVGHNLLSKAELYAFYEFLVCMLKDRFQYFNEYPEFVDLGNKIDWTGVIKQHGLPEEVIEYVQKTTNCSDNYIRLLNGTQSYLADMKRYESWVLWKKNRNPERAALELKSGFDGKNASHCLRLQFMLIEILKEGYVRVRRTSDADYLKSVRQGQVSYEEVMSLSNELKLEAEVALKNTTLPKKVDRNFIDDILLRILTREFGCSYSKAF